MGEFVEKPVISGHGSALVYPKDERIESPLDYIREECGEDIELNYVPLYPYNGVLGASGLSKLKELYEVIDGADIVIMFGGRADSVETEGTDISTSKLDPFYEFFIKRIYPRNPNIVFVAQTGGSLYRYNVET